MSNPVLERQGRPRTVARQLLDFFERLRESADAFCEGQPASSIAARAALTVFLAYTGVRYMADDFYTSLFDGLTLVVHEAGHLLCRGFGHTIYFLGGSAMQLLVPAFVSVYLLVRQRDGFGFAVGLSWLGFSGWNLATYVADANKGNLPLAQMGPEPPKHDWETLLTEWHYLNACETIARGLRVCAFASWAVAMVVAGWLLFRMVSLRKGIE